MKLYFSRIFTLMWKDILLETRTKENITPIIIFASLVLLIFNFALDPTPILIGSVAPGILWTAITFSGILGMSRTFILEKDNGSLEGIIICPVSREIIYFGKMLASLVFMLLIEALIFPIFGILFNLPILIPSVILIAFLTTLGFAAIGTIFSAISVHTRAREIMLPILFFPIVVPIILAAVESTSLAIQFEGWKGIISWIQLIVVFDIIFIVVSAFLFQFALEE